MEKYFMIFAMVLIGFLTWGVYTSENTCLEDLSKHMATCKPFECRLTNHPYAKTEDHARIYGMVKGKCLYKVDTGNIRTTCQFPKHMLKKMAAELDQKARVEKTKKTIRKTRKNVRMNPKTGKKEVYPEVLIDGKWEEYHQNLTKSMADGTCTAYNKKTKKKVK